VESQFSSHTQDLNCYVWLLPFLIISCQNLIAMHTSLHKRPAPEMTICSSNLISSWATRTVNENMDCVSGHMQLRSILGISVVAVVLWIGTLPSQVSSVLHLFTSTSPPCRVSSSVDLMLSEVNFSYLSSYSKAGYSFLKYLILFSCFHQNCIVTSSCICIQ